MWGWRRETFRSKLMKTDLEDCWWRCTVEAGWGRGLCPLWGTALGGWTYRMEWRNRWGCWGKPGPARSWRRWETPAGTGACWGCRRQRKTPPRPRAGPQPEERWGWCGGTTWHGEEAAETVARRLRRGRGEDGQSWLRLEWKQRQGPRGPRGPLWREAGVFCPRTRFQCESVKSAGHLGI